jgi:hypothetical protein
MKLTTEQKKSVAAVLKDSLNKYTPRHWYIDAVYPWISPANKYKDCICLTCDGFPRWKFQFVGKTLRLCWQYSDSKVSIKTGRFVSLIQFDQALKECMKPLNIQLKATCPSIAGEI